MRALHGVDAHPCFLPPTLVRGAAHDRSQPALVERVFKASDPTSRPRALGGPIVHLSVSPIVKDFEGKTQSVDRIAKLRN